MDYLRMMEKKQEEYSKDENATFEDFYDKEELEKWQKIAHKEMAIKQRRINELLKCDETPFNGKK